MTIEQVETPPLNRRQKAKARTREKVLDAATALFDECGYEQATIRDIAKKAEKSTGAIFANFSDKLDLYAAVLLEKYASFEQSAESWILESATSKARLLELCMADYEFTAARDHLMGILASQGTRRDESYGRARVVAKRMREHFTGLVQRVIFAGMDEGELADNADKTLAIDAIVNIHLGAVQHASLYGMNAIQYKAYLLPQLSILLFPSSQEESKAA